MTATKGRWGGGGGILMSHVDPKKQSYRNVEFKKHV